MAMPQAVRHINETRALAVLLKCGTLSRADLARELSVTRSTASSIVASLIESGHVHEFDDDLSPRRRTGRPSIRIGLNPDHALFLGADIAIGRIRFCAIDMLGKIRHSESIDMSGHGQAPDLVVARLGDAIERFAATVADPAVIKGVNLSVPGIVDLSGHVLRAPQLGWKNVPLLCLLRERVPDVELRKLENDANAFSVAEREHRRDDNIRNAIFILMDEGIGGCLVNGGAIIQGHSGYAGEIGHMVIGDRGYTDQVPIEGSLESFVGRTALLERHRHHGGQARRIADLESLLAAGEDAASRAIADWAGHLARGISILIAVFNPERIVFGGRVSRLIPHAHDRIVQDLRRHLLPDTSEPILEVSDLGDDVSAIGAALILRRQYFSLDAGFLSGIEVITR